MATRDARSGSNTVDVGGRYQSKPRSESEVLQTAFLYLCGLAKAGESAPSAMTDDVTRYKIVVVPDY